MFGIGFGELDAIVRVMHGIDPDNAALTARFKYMQRLGFPEGVNSGRGVRSIYGLEEVLKVLLAIELLEAGATPTRVVRTVRTSWAEMRRAFAVAWLVAAEAQRRSNRLLIGSSLRALSELGQEEDPAAPVAEPLRSINVSDVADWLNGDYGQTASKVDDLEPLLDSRRLIIDPMRTVAALRILVPGLTAMEAEDLDDAFQELGAAAFRGLPPSQWLPA